MTAHGHPLLADGKDLVAFQPTPPRAFDEARIQTLIDAHPELMPFEALHEPDFGGARSLGIEVNIATDGPGRRLDVLLVNEQGRLTIVETKLFSNPEARREALAQIIEYAALLQELDYEALGDLVRANRTEVAIPEGADPLVTIAREAGLAIADEAAFHDRIQHDLEHGRFLLLIVGEGIHRNLSSMQSFLDRTAHMAFTLGLVELRHYTSTPPGRELWVPTVVGAVEAIQRQYITAGENLVATAGRDMTDQVGSSTSGSGRKRTQLGELEAREEFFRRFDAATSEPAPHTIRSLITRADTHGIELEFSSTGSALIVRCTDEITEYPYNLLTITGNGRLGSTDFLEWQLKSQGRDPSLAVKHYKLIADLFGGASWVPAPTTRNPDRCQIKDDQGMAPAFSAGIDKGLEPNEFLERLFTILEDTAQAIRAESKDVVEKG